MEEGGERERRERIVFMLVVTEVFIAPPTQGESGRERMHCTDKKRERGRRQRGVQRRGEKEQQEEDITEGLLC